MTDAGDGCASGLTYHVQRTAAFSTWLDGLRDRPTRLRLIRRLERVARGQLGDVKALGNGLFEMREHFGPGWRLYYLQRGTRLLVVLGGGEKSTQATDIEKAFHLAKTLAATLGGITYDG